MAAYPAGRRDVDGELYLLYLLRTHHGQGIGRALFDACHLELARRGHHGMLVWVLAWQPPHVVSTNGSAGNLPARAKVAIAGSQPP